MSLPLERIPTTKDERWKYTNLPRALKKLDLKPASLGWASNVALLEPTAPGEKQYRDTNLWDLNTAHVSDVQFFSGDAEIDVTAQDGKWLSPRIVIDIKDNQTVTIVERQNGQGAYWKNTVVQIRIGNNSTLRHYRMNAEAADGVSTIFTHVKVGRDSTYETFSLIEGAGFVRNQTHAEIQGENGHCWMNGINLLRATNMPIRQSRSSTSSRIALPSRLLNRSSMVNRIACFRARCMSTRLPRKRMDTSFPTR